MCVALCAAAGGQEDNGSLGKESQQHRQRWRRFQVRDTFAAALPGHNTRGIRRADRARIPHDKTRKTQSPRGTARTPPSPARRPDPNAAPHAHDAMGTAACGGKWFKAAVSGERPTGAARCRQQYHQASCQPPLPVGDGCSGCGVHAASPTSSEGVLDISGRKTRCATATCLGRTGSLVDGFVQQRQSFGGSVGLPRGTCQARLEDVLVAG